jgi:hypothetical protein
MGFRIEDGKGDGNLAHVDSNNRLSTIAVSFDLFIAASDDGDAFTICTDFISLTTTSTEHGILYVYNNHPTDRIHLAPINVSSDSNMVKWKLYKNPTTGTLISAGTDVTPTNINFSSGKSFIGTTKKGSNGSTVTNGTLVGCLSSTYFNEIDSTHAVILERGNSIAITAEVSATTVVAITLPLFFHYHS